MYHLIIPSCGKRLTLDMTKNYSILLPFGQNHKQNQSGIVISGNFSIKVFAILILQVFFCATLISQTYQNDFLNIGIGARGQAMMGASIASSADVFSTYWNPAGLTRIEESLQVGAMHAEWFTGVVKHDYLGVAKSLDTLNKAFGAISVIRSGVDNIPNTLNLYDANGAINYDNISEFSFASYGIFFTYARALKNQNWRIGGSAKLLFSQAGPFGKAWGIGIDGSVLYEKNGFMFGVLARDITTTYNRWTYTFTDEQKEVFLETGNEILSASTEVTRPSLLPSIGYKRNFKEYSILLEAMGNLTIDGQRNVLLSSSSVNIDPAVGLEFGYKNLAFLRAGLGNFQKIRNISNPEKADWNMRPAFGIGLDFGRFRLDYALTNVGNSANNRYSHIFSAILGFRHKPNS
jgi:hypothetical protein